MRDPFKTQPEFFMSPHAMPLETTRHQLEDLLLAPGVEATPIHQAVTESLALPIEAGSEVSDLATAA